MNSLVNYRIQIKRHARRRNVSLFVIDANTIEVRAPQWVADSYIQQLLQKKQAWIEAQLKKQATPQTFTDGALVWINGDEVRIRWHNSGRSLCIKGDLNIAAKNELEAEKKVVSFLRKLAVDTLEDKADFWVSKTGLSPNSISVRSFSARWGSCDSRGDIKLNWRLIQAPPVVQDYVIIHELSHLQEMNHSVHFWRCVEQFEANYKQHRKWLKDNANRLMAIGS